MEFELMQSGFKAHILITLHARTFLDTGDKILNETDNRCFQRTYDFRKGSYRDIYLTQGEAANTEESRDEEIMQMVRGAFKEINMAMGYWLGYLLATV